MTIFSPFVDRLSTNFAENIYPAYSFFKSFKKSKSKPSDSQITYLSRDNFDFAKNPERGTKMTYRYKKYINRNTRRFPSFTTAYKTPSGGYTSTRRKYYRKKYYRKRYYLRYNNNRVGQKSLMSGVGTKFTKKLNSNRSHVGLPPMKVNKVELFDPLNSANQWVAPVAGTWSYFLSPTVIQRDANNVQAREGNTLKFLKTNIYFQINQPRDTTIRYRFLVIKNMSKSVVSIATAITPDNVFSHTGSIEEMLISNYLTEEDERTYPFKVVLDKFIVINSHGSDDSVRHFKFPLPVANVEYSEADETGDISRLGYAFCILTNATAASAQYYYGIKTVTRFLDVI